MVTHALPRRNHRLIGIKVFKNRCLAAFEKQLRRGSLAKAAAISSLLVIVGLFTLLRFLAWLLPTRVQWNFVPTIGNVIFLFLLALLFTFPVMWLVRIFYRDDIAELERRVAERTAELRAANRELEAFSYSVSHDLRSPLRHIHGFSQLLVADLGADLRPLSRRYVEQIVTSSKKMESLIDDLLKMAQIGRQELIRNTVELKTIVDSVIQDLQPEYEGRQIDWRVGDLPTLACDQGLARVVFANLLSNAVKYTRRVEHAVIEIGQTLHEGIPVIFIRDNGVGFDPKFAHKLFSAFQRLHRSEEFEGTGIGLATVRRIVEKHGGQVWAEAKANEGATFCFTLTPHPIDISFDVSIPKASGARRGAD